MDLEAEVSPTRPRVFRSFGVLLFWCFVVGKNVHRVERFVFVSCRFLKIQLESRSEFRGSGLGGLFPQINESPDVFDERSQNSISHKQKQHTNKSKSLLHRDALIFCAGALGKPSAGPWTRTGFTPDRF